MPTYEYVCNECGHEFEEFHGINTPSISICPSCNKESVRRKISGGGGILFKGSGFYSTDYKNTSSHKESSEPSCTAGSSCAACQHNSSDD